MAWRQVTCPFERDRKSLQYLIGISVFTDDGEIVFIVVLQKALHNYELKKTFLLADLFISAFAFVI